MDQQTWNFLFSWITGEKCFLPEGCSPPLIGILVYLALILSFLGIVYLERYQMVGAPWKK